MRITKEYVRRTVEAEITARYSEPGFGLADETWQGLVEQGYVKEFIDAQSVPDVQAGLLESMVESVEKWHKYTNKSLTAQIPKQAAKMFPQRNGPDERRPRNLPLRQEAISAILAHDARLREDVQWYRKQVLKDRLLQPDEVEAWVKGQAEKDGTPTMWLEFPVPSTYRFELSKDGIGVLPPLTISKRKPLRTGNRRRKMLRYLGLPSRIQRSKIVSSGGALDELRIISRDLSRKFPWDEAQGTLFVLTDWIPWVEAIRAETKLDLFVPVAARIVLTIDPMLSPKQVADAYQKVRQDEMGVERHRNLEAKHLHLAMFSVQRPGAETLKDSMQRWNGFCRKTKHPEWKYKPEQLTNFGRDLTRDPRRLLGLERRKRR